MTEEETVGGNNYYREGEQEEDNEHASSHNAIASSRADADADNGVDVRDMSNSSSSNRNSRNKILDGNDEDNGDVHDHGGGLQQPLSVDIPEQYDDRPTSNYDDYNSDDDDYNDVTSNDSDRRHRYSRTLLEEIQEVLPQSYMIFLIADLRLMSGTGRIRTRYETIAIDSDLAPRTTANEVACIGTNEDGRRQDTTGLTPSDDRFEFNKNSISSPDFPSSDMYETIEEETDQDEEEKVDEDQNPSVPPIRKPRKENAGRVSPSIPRSSKITKHTSREHSMHQRASEGLTPRQVMAILLLELRDSFLAAKMDSSDERYEKGMDSDQQQPPASLTEDFRNYRSSKKSQRNIEDSMETLLRAYARMISADLVSEVASVKRRRETMARTSSMMRLDGISPLSPMNTSSGASSYKSNTINNDNNNNNIFSLMASTPSGPPPSIPASVMASIKEEVEGYETRSDESDEGDDGTWEGEFTAQHGHSEPLREQDGHSTEIGPGTLRATSESQGKSTREYLQDYNPLAAANRKQITNNLKERQKRVTQAYNDRVDAVLPQNREANTQKEFEELNNILFGQSQADQQLDTTASGSVRPGEMVRIMRKAVESRDDDRLSFLSRLFKDGSVSQLIAESHARVVWINDWFPLKDLTYAIAVDTKLKRVLVVFRGAITSTDWKMVSKYSLEKIPNPVKDEYEGKKERLRVFQGFYTYLFRRRMDTGSNKYEEIARLVHKYGTERIGDDYTVFVTGHSLGAGLSVFFSFFASTDERFTKNGPVKAIAFAGPYCGGHGFCDAFRHQERSGKLMFARVHNNNDPVPYMPFNFRIGGRGCLWRHVGIGIVLPPIPLFRRWKPRVTYFGKEKTWLSSVLRAYRQNVLFHFPWWQAWNFARMHTLFELQDRLMYGLEEEKAGGDFRLLNKTFEELYDDLERNEFDTLKNEISVSTTTK